MNEATVTPLIWTGGISFMKAMKWLIMRFPGFVSGERRARGYVPTVTISTKKNGDKILISVKDNGNGIPQNIIDKIFQPFFTTKPTGQGTGLGLSLSYDIIKAHGGEIKVNSKEGEGSEFIIQLLFNKS